MNRKKFRALELCEQGGGLDPHSLSHSFPVPSHTVTVSVDAKHHEKKKVRAQELCEQGGGPRLALILHHIIPWSLISRTVSVDAKHHENKKVRAQ